MGGTVRKKTKSTSKTAKVKSATRPKKTAAKRTQSKVQKARPAAVSKKKTDTYEEGQPRRKRTAKQLEQTLIDFRSVVNVSSDQLARWLSTPESNKIHFPDEPKLNPGNKVPGPVILSLLKKRREKYTETDFDQMDNVVRFVRERLTKKPKGDIVASNWRYSLMNWGHDPTKRPKRVSK
jgi:hypothetical protein